MAIAPRLAVAAALLLPSSAVLADDEPLSPPPPPSDQLEIPAAPEPPPPPPRPHSRVTTHRHARTDEPAAAQLIAPATPPAAAAPAPGLTLPDGDVLLALTVESGVGKDKMFEPFSFAPDLSYGATSDLTLSIVTSYAALTGFRGASGAGLCMNSNETTCRQLYNDVGIEGLYTLTRGTFQLAGNAGFLVTSIGPWHTDAKIGAKAKLALGRFYALASPSIWYALDDRSNRVVPHDHQLWLPVSAWVKPARVLALGVASGFKGPLLELHDKYSVPLGASVVGTLEKGVSLGASFVFGKVWGGPEVMDPGWDARSVHVWLSVQRDGSQAINRVK